MMRLFPRFSLRFAWIALTIFLVVFAVVGNYWNRWREHEAFVGQLCNHNWSVEEESITLFGQLIGKRLTGIHAQSLENKDLPIYLDIPQPGDLRRLAIQCWDKKGGELDSIMAKIEQSPELERLHLQSMDLTREQLQRLAKLKKLRLLDLRYVEIPPQSLAFLEELPELEILLLGNTHVPLRELFSLRLPQLRMLDLSGSKEPVLPLTIQGLGRFPMLETLLLYDSKFQKIACEPGALLRLRHLDLGLQGSFCEIEWKQLPETVPLLEGLAIHEWQYNAQVDHHLRRCENLQKVLFCNTNVDGIWDGPQYPYLMIGRGERFASIIEPKEPLAAAWLKREPALEFYGEYSDFFQAIVPAELKVFHIIEMDWPNSKWHPNSKIMKVGLF